MTQDKDANGDSSRKRTERNPSYGFGKSPAVSLDVKVLNM